MKKIVFMVFLILLSSCAAYKPIEDFNGLNIVVANDLHYAHQSMIGNHERSRDITLKADGKQINYLPEIIEAFVYQMKQEQPDVIILNGDIVFNGERDNHIYLSKLLSDLDALVLINPGNHDIDSPDAIRMNEYRSYRMGSVTQDEFKKIYQNYGYHQASSQDFYSLSYKVKVSDSLHIVMLDSRCDSRCEDLNDGLIKPETLAWLENELKTSKDENAEVIVASHHSVLIHYPRLREGFVIQNDKELKELLNKYDVKLVLTGHIHVQHIATETNLVDIATQSLAVYKNQYGVINYIPHDSLSYKTESVDVSAYAKEQQWDNLELLNFEKTSLDTMTYVNYRRTALRLFDEFSILDEQDLLDIASFDGKIKAYYFSGQLSQFKDEILQDEHFKHLIEKYEHDTRSLMNSLEYFSNRDHTQIKIDLK